MPSIFLCHSHKDKPFARELSERLRAHGIRTWIDEAEMQVGDSLISKIEVAIQEFTYLGIILSPDSVSSEWVRREVNIALTQEIQGRTVKVLPIRYKNCRIPGFLAERVYADLSEDFEEGFAKILARLMEDLYEEKHKQKRAYEILQTAYQDWISFGRKDHQLLNRDTIALVTQNLAQVNLSLDLMEYLFCSASYLSEHEEIDLDKLKLRLDEIEPVDIVNLFDRLLKHLSPRVRVGIVGMIERLNETRALESLISRIVPETDRGVRRACLRSISHLRGQLPEELAQFLLDSDKDWLVQSYALLSLGRYRSCLLISDGTDFAAELGMIAQEAGFTLVTLSISLLSYELEEAGEDILRAHELLILVRGEHYSRGMNEDFYLRLRRFVMDGGALFATSWVSWETKYLHEFVNVLPFIHVRDTYNEDVIITCRSAGDELSQKLFPNPITYRTSFEALQVRGSSITLLETDDGIPIFGYHHFGRGICYYLNTCQHSCLSRMLSPLQTSLELYSCLQMIFEWIHKTKE